MLPMCNAYDGSVHACETSVRAKSALVELAPPYFVDTAETKLRTHPTVRKPSGIPPTTVHDDERFQQAVTIPNYIFFVAFTVQTVVTPKMVVPTGRVCVK